MEGLGEVDRTPMFVTNLYNVVEDPNTDNIISWGSAGKSFVIWDTYAFVLEIIPRHFKNASSFTRELRSYGFREVYVRPFGSELANEGFQRGQRELLKTIKRERPPSTPSSSQQGQAPSQARLEVGLDSELQRDKGTPLAEVAKQRQEQQATGRPIQTSDQTGFQSSPNRLRQESPIPSYSPHGHGERSDLDMPRSVADGSHILVNMENLESRGSSPSFGSGQDAQMRRCMTMPDSGTHGLSGGRHHPERTRGYPAAATTIAAYGAGTGGGVSAVRETEAQQQPSLADLEAGGGSALPVSDPTAGGIVRAVLETEARQGLRSSLADSDLEAGGGSAAPAQQPSAEQAKAVKKVLLQTYPALIVGSFMAYPVLKDAPKYVKITIFGGLVVIITIVLFAGILSKSLARRSFAFWVVFCSAIAFLTLNVASQLS